MVGSVNAEPLQSQQPAAPLPVREGGPGTVSVAEFRRAAGCFATGITVVTTVADGVDHAMTANAFTSVSLDPLLVLVCVEKTTRFHAAILASGRWAVSVLAESAKEAAAWFATRGRPLEGQLNRFPHDRGPHTGAAILRDSMASMECRTHAVYDGGDHSIVVGEVLAVRAMNPQTSPLLYFRGGYHTLGRAT
ncbi:flavin reductase [Carbonactinospora thermoautotrophica]|nr:flavin reductase [Carbonactinospora thermoautotrophica]